MAQHIYPIRIQPKLLKQSRKAALDEGLPLAEVIRRLIVLWLDHKVKLPK
jgi:hypothetical protein